MKQINVSFEKDDSLEQIDIIIRASEKDDTVLKIIEKVSNFNHDKLSVIDSNNTHKVINVDDVISFSVEGKKTNVFTLNETYYMNQSLQSIESMVNSRLFVRISRFEIINLTKVLRYDFTLVGTLRIELENGAETWASRRCIPLVRKRLSGKE